MSSSTTSWSLPKPTPRRISLAIAGAVSSFAWYASPDYTRSKTALRLTRLGLAALLGALTVYIADDTVKQVRQDISAASPDQEEWRMDSETVQLKKENLNLPKIGLLAGCLAALASLTIWMELNLFRRGERRRAAGVAYPHTRQAVPLALLGATGYFLDDSQAA